MISNIGISHVLIFIYVVFSADLYFWVESICLISVGEEFPTVEAAEEMIIAQLFLFTVTRYIELCGQNRRQDF